MVVQSEQLDKWLSNLQLGNQDRMAKSMDWSNTPQLAILPIFPHEAVRFPSWLADASGTHTRMPITEQTCPS